MATKQSKPLLLEIRGDNVLIDIELFESILNKADILMMFDLGIYPDTYEYVQMDKQTRKSMKDIIARWEKIKHA